MSCSVTLMISCFRAAGRGAVTHSPASSPLPSSPGQALGPHRPGQPQGQHRSHKSSFYLGSSAAINTTFLSKSILSPAQHVRETQKRGDTHHSHHSLALCSSGLPSWLAHRSFPNPTPPGTGPREGWQVQQGEGWGREASAQGRAAQRRSVSLSPLPGRQQTKRWPPPPLALPACSPGPRSRPAHHPSVLHPPPSSRLRPTWPLGLGRPGPQGGCPGPFVSKYVYFCAKRFPHVEAAERITQPTPGGSHRHCPIGSRRF